MAVSKTPPIPILAGPTGGGKSSLAHALAREQNAEIIVADSRQVYKHLDIGTEKPTPREQEEVRYHLIDRILPGESYSAFRFLSEATERIADCIKRGRIPMVVGGTGFYIRALTQGLHALPSDAELRRHLPEELAARGPHALMQELRSIDPEIDQYLHPSHRQRLLRMVEITRLIGKTPRQISAETTRSGSPYAFETVILVPEREELYERINGRTETQLAGGMLAEVRRLKQEGWEDAIRRSRIICYTELLDFLSGSLTLAEASAQIQQNCRRLAKRQTTWFRREPGAIWCPSAEEARKALLAILSRWKTVA